MEVYKCSDNFIEGSIFLGNCFDLVLQFIFVDVEVRRDVGHAKALPDGDVLLDDVVTQDTGHSLSAHLVVLVTRLVLVQTFFLRCFFHFFSLVYLLLLSDTEGVDVGHTHHSVGYLTMDHVDFRLYKFLMVLNETVKRVRDSQKTVTKFHRNVLQVLIFHVCHSVITVEFRDEI